MDMSVARIAEVFKTYQRQDRMAELNKRSSIKSVQGQVDVVRISEEAQQKINALQSGGKGGSRRTPQA